MAIANTESSDRFYTWRINTNKMSAFYNDAGGDHKYIQNFSEQSVNYNSGAIVTAGGIGVAKNISVNGIVGITPESALRIPYGNDSQRSTIPSAGHIRFNTDSSKIEYWDSYKEEWKEIGSQIEDTDQDTKITVDTDKSDEDHVRIFTGNNLTESTERITVNGSSIIANADTKILFTIGDSTNSPDSQTNGYLVDRRNSDGNDSLNSNYTTNEFYGYVKIPVNGTTGPSDTGTNGLGTPGMVRFDPVRGFEGYLSAGVWAGLGGLVDSADGQDTYATAYGANNATSVDAGGDDDSTLNMFRFWVGNTTPDSSREALRIDRRSSDNGNTVDPFYPTTEIYGQLRLPVNGETGTPDTEAYGNGVPGMVRFDPVRGFEGYLSSFVWAGLGGAVDSANLGDTFISVYGADDSSAVVSSGDDDSTEDMIRVWIGNTSGSSSEALRIDRRTADGSFSLDEQHPTTEVYGFFRLPVNGETGTDGTDVYSNGVPGMVRYVNGYGFQGFDDVSESWLDLSGMHDEDYDTKITLDTDDPSDEDHIRFYIGGTESVQKMVINSTTTFVDTNVRITGDLQVTGTTSTIGATNLSVEDNLIYLNGPGDYDTTFTGSGQNTATFYGYYEGTGTVVYKVEIDNDTSNPNTFKWYKDNVEQTSGIGITGNNQELDNNIYIRFDNGITGWTTGDYWEATAAPVNVDLGFTGNYNDGATYAHAGLFRDISDNKWKFFDGLQEEPGSDINITGTGFSLADVELKDLEVQGDVQSSNSTTGSLTVDGGVGISKNLNVDGTIKLWNTTEATSTAGALKVDGGVNIQKKLYTKGEATLADQVFITDTTDSTSTTTGALVVSGGVGIAKHLHVGTTSYFNGSTYFNYGEGLEFLNGGDLTADGWGNDNRLINIHDGNPPADGWLVFTADSSVSGDHGTYIMGMSKSQVKSIQQFKVDNTTDSTSTTTGALVVSGGVGISKALRVGGKITETSSIVFKENIKPIQNSLNTIEQLKGVFYEWKDKREDGQQIGLIAEEVQKVLPEVSDGTSVAYTKLIGLLVEGIKELKKEVEILKNK